MTVNRSAEIQQQTFTRPSSSPNDFFMSLIRNYGLLYAAAWHPDYKIAQHKEVGEEKRGEQECSTLFWKETHSLIHYSPKKQYTPHYTTMNGKNYFPTVRLLTTATESLGPRGNILCFLIHPPRRKSHLPLFASNSTFCSSLTRGWDTTVKYIPCFTRFTPTTFITSDKRL